MLPIDLRGKRALVAGVADDNGFGWAIAKHLIEAGATVENSVIRGPAIIGPGARIRNAYVGPFTSIGRDVEIRDSEIEHSIVLEGALIHDLDTRVCDSLIGRGVKIHRLPLKPSAHRFMLGDNSEVWIRW